MMHKGNCDRATFCAWSDKTYFIAYWRQVVFVALEEICSWNWSPLFEREKWNVAFAKIFSHVLRLWQWGRNFMNMVTW